MMWTWVVCVECHRRFSRAADFEGGDPARCLECQPSGFGARFAIFVMRHGRKK